MRSICIIVCLLFYVSTQAQSIPDRSESMPASTLSLQRQAWLKAGRNADAWLNQYILTERDKSTTNRQKVADLTWMVQSSKDYIAASWQYQLMLYLQSGKTDRSAIYKSLEIATDKTVVYPYIIQYSIIAGEHSAIQEYAKKLWDAKPLSKNLYEYHYNTLMSATPGATIYARGIGDLVSLAMVQQATQVRPDVVLKFYTGTIPNRNNAYLCLSVGKDEIEKFPQAGYTGLLVALSSKNTLQQLVSHYENDFKWDALSATNLQDSEVPYYKNYLPSLILLYRYYNSVQHKQANVVLQIIQRIANRAGVRIDNDLLQKL